ncbi:unnamed protein product [Rotaria magnacalcarata]|uniref:F-box domain-containing protein n=1 Tax=Rotaria magnacalcarata TaxID=392030 RepID=A0A815Y832_9BILA|nr:unnamed protein product [Rotaria magnacalcarata]CAF1677194.1 unnamed protein product [Rotaria magnacalcarata]CAF3927595.1 unnamed protein product [Rotaria magnacalcarata]CAF3931098.1 unnamed protein product [Rotaria magnacalcarata]CAF3989653.1 unnamed protein product [Rotaria magnacalcarata]
MADNQHELVQHCIDSEEFVTIKFYDHYLLFHQNLVKYSNNNQLDLELSPSTIRKIFGLKPLSIKDAQKVNHVDSSFYDVIIFADKSIVYTRKRTLSYADSEHESATKSKILPYYVYEDLELLRSIGLSKDDIDLFITKLNENDNTDLFNTNKYDQFFQKIINYTDVSTRLKCRQVSHKWKNFVDNSISWNHVKLSKNCRCIDRALQYFQNVDIRELDLSESGFELSTSELNSEIHLYSLRSLYISTDHPLELLTLLFKIAPFLQHIKLIQTFDSSIKLKNGNQLYECINFVICQCQQRLKCLRRLQIQVRSMSDQIFLESSSVASIPISYEIVCVNDIIHMVEERNFQFWRRLLIIFNIFYIILAFTFLFFAIFTRVNSLIIDLHLLVGLIFLSLYLIFLSVFVVLFLFQFILACTYLTIRDEKKYDLLKESYEKSIDHIQLKYNCCGFSNLTNFNRNVTCQNLPCCHSTDQCCETLPMCYTLLNSELNKNLKIIGSILLVFTITQIIAIYMTLKFRNTRNPAIFI